MAGKIRIKEKLQIRILRKSIVSIYERREMVDETLQVFCWIKILQRKHFWHNTEAPDAYNNVHWKTRIEIFFNVQNE